MTPGEFWQKVTLLCHAFDCRVTSGPRSPRWNKQVGGVNTSLHLYGLAADVAGFDPTRKAELTQTAARLGIKAIDEGDHLHLQPTQ